MLRAIDFHGLKGVEFSKGEYTALLIPEMDDEEESQQVCFDCSFHVFVVS